MITLADWSLPAASFFAPVLGSDQSACPAGEHYILIDRSSCPTNGVHFKDPVALSLQPPHLWPSPLHLECRKLDPVGQLEALLEWGDIVQGVLVDLTACGVGRLGAVLGKKPVFRGCLVVTLSPACPTREEDLRQLLNLRDEFQGDSFSLKLGILPLPSGVTPEARHAVTPPSVLLVQNRQLGQGWLWHGTNGDLDLHAPYHTGSFNLILPASPAVMDLWQHQFDYVSAKAAPLKETSITIPRLVPAPGEIEAARVWSAYCTTLYRHDDKDSTAHIEINPVSGEITAVTVGGQPVETASSACNVKLLPAELREILPRFDQGSLVIVDEATRIKPLTIPVKSLLFGQQSEEQFGTVTRKQSFSLALLDDKTAKEIERCRNINATIGLFSFSLGLGSHWIPHTAKPLLEKELCAMDAAAKLILGVVSAKGGPQAWVEAKWPSYLKDLQTMYKQVRGDTGEPPRDRLDEIKKVAVDRLSKAINGRLVPKVSYGSYMPEIAVTGGSLSGLSKVLHLLKSSALVLREPSANSFFERNFSKRSVTMDDWLSAMNVFGDTAPERLSRQKANTAKQEQQEIEDLCDDPEQTEETKLTSLWKIVQTAAKT